MSNNLDLVLHNWRCFDTNRFSIPLKSFTIVDSNGSGKTSLLSAIYSLFTGNSWPGTKFVQNLQSGAGYFGISTKFVDWHLTGKVSANGRLVLKYNKPEVTSSALELASSWPKILTYLPTDNYWLSQSRSAKLAVLDNLLCQVYGKEYADLLTNFDQVLKSKQKLIKYCLENQLPGDKILITNLSSQIFYLTSQIWDYRAKFLAILQANFCVFNSWLNIEIENFKLKWFTTNLIGQKDCTDFSRSEFVSTKHDGEIDWLKIWQKELITGKVLYGAHRDDFIIESKNHLPVETVFSRGEMRLFILFIKNLARQQIIDNNVWWFLDDIFNELDSQREKRFYEEVLCDTDLFIATSTKKTDQDSDSYSLEKLTMA